MNIAIFSDSYLPQVNGIASSLGLLNERLLELGHQVTIFTPKVKEASDNSESIIRIKSIKIRENPPFYIGSPLSWPAINLLRHKDFDIIHAHTPLTMGMLAYQVSHLFKKPLVYTYHTMLSEYTHYIGWLSKTSLTRKIVNHFDFFSCNVCDMVIAPSPKVKNFLQARGLSTAFEVVPNGVRLDRFKEINKGYFRLRPDVKETDKILLFVGRLGQEKNPSFPIKALAQLLQKMDGVKLVFAGSGYLLPELKQLAAELKISSEVLFLDNVPFDDMPTIYADADIFVSAATTEAHPMALLEAIASGMPVVAINDDAFASAVVHGKNGFLTNPDEQIFANRLLNILQNPTLQQNMSAESLKISKLFSIEAQTHKLLGIYFSLIANNRKQISQCGAEIAQ